MTIAPFHSDLPAGRQRYLALGRYYADAIGQIRQRGLPAAIEAAQAMAGATQPRYIARGLLQAATTSGVVPSFRIASYPRRRFEDGAPVIDRVVEIPRLTWRFRGHRQVGAIEWVPVFGATNRGAAPAIRRPLPV